jgi:uncharacterized protein YgbK (DUF1537 family)
VRDSHVVRVLRQQSRRAIGLVPLAAVAAGPAAIRGCLREQVRGGAQVLVCDAESEDHLRALVATQEASTTGDVLWVGSAGLAQQLASRVDAPAGIPPRPSSQCADGPVLVVAGSASERTQRQLLTLQARCSVHPVELSLRGVLEDGADLERCRRELDSALTQGRHCILAVGRADTTCARGDDLAGRIARALGELAAQAARAHALGGLILTGGDTARAVAEALGARGLEIHAEVEPGVPLGRLIGRTRLPVVTKAGAFGSELALVHALDHLKKKGAPTT